MKFISWCIAYLLLWAGVFISRLIGIINYDGLLTNMMVLLSFPIVYIAHWLIYDWTNEKLGLNRKSIRRR